MALDIERTLIGLELQARLQARASRDAAEKQEHHRQATDALRTELAAHRQTTEAILVELRIAQRAGLWGWASANPWSAVALLVVVILGLSGQLYLLPSLAPIFSGVAHATGS